jgi:hypothetical protein
MLVGMPHEPAGVTVTLAFAITRNFQFAFLTPEVYQQLPLLRSFFLHSFQSQRTGHARQGLKSHDLPHSAAISRTLLPAPPPLSNELGNDRKHHGVRYYRRPGMDS